ncbi:choline-phosphate cytidylyltransferase [Nematocida displodere]|uniref:choline-phosphate cytidylyltransferase n=1 Tax=Nematocida displodere TaxID=1805483 RepID=A0A177EDT9_9MICR|nr:choline-phosphate cytidylyltransferase [Nematocida displodere]
MRMLEQVRKRFPKAVIVVGICSDEATHTHKGKTVMKMAERAESLRHCKWIDEIIEDAPWVITEEFLQKYKIDYVAHDEDKYPSNNHEDVYHYVKEKGIFVPTQRTEGISTSDLITRVLYSYDTFLKRNLDRGVSGKELNISSFTEKRILLGGEVEKNLSKIRSKFKDFSEVWERVSGDLARGFAGLFDSRMTDPSYPGSPASTPTKSPARKKASRGLPGSRGG